MPWLSALGGLLPSLPVAATTDDPTLVVVLAVLGSSATAAAIGAYARRKSGEGPAATARDMTEAVGGLIEATEQLHVPQQLRIISLTQEVADLTRKWSESRIEVHEERAKSAQALADLEVAKFELNALREREASPGGRRADDAGLS